MDGRDVCVGMTVRFRPGPEVALADAHGAMVTAVGNEQITCHVFIPGFAQPDERSGVMHSTHPNALQNCQRNEDAGIWDYVERQPPEEVDKSKEKGRVKPADRVKPSRDVASVS